MPRDPQASNWSRVRSALFSDTALALLLVICIVALASVVSYAFVQSALAYLDWLDCGLRQSRGAEPARIVSSFSSSSPPGVST
ncbi:hypothetical protein GALL_404560 [mine drainage metagenome]|uniref:Uncharacterized protein n=1 Tax=mine drainage metagenome TaxID=410659 RepID=A0A1J5Q3F3_9ZZZZ